MCELQMGLWCMVTVRQQYFQLRAPLCNEALETSCLLADEGMQVGF